MKYSIVIPVYKNAASIGRLLGVLAQLNQDLSDELEVVFVVDGSPDESYALLREQLDQLAFAAQLISHSRNFGSFAAIRTGLAAARGHYFAVMAADLQEPSEVFLEFFRVLTAGEHDVVIGTRSKRSDPWFSRMAATVFWKIYRRFVMPEIPPGGVDVFGCNRLFRDRLLELEESRSSLVALVFWLGFRRAVLPYERQERQEGVSSWSFRRKSEYFMDSVFSFTDYPIRALGKIGLTGALITGVVGAITITARLTGLIVVPGYAATLLVIMLFGFLNLLGLGLVGSYAWRAYENSKHRPLAVVLERLSNDKDI